MEVSGDRGRQTGRRNEEQEETATGTSPVWHGEMDEV